MGMELGSRFLVPDSERVLVREAMRRMLPKWIDGLLSRGEETDDRPVLPLRMALRRERERESQIAVSAHVNKCSHRHV